MHLVNLAKGVPYIAHHAQHFAKNLLDNRVSKRMVAEVELEIIVYVLGTLPHRGVYGLGVTVVNHIACKPQWQPLEIFHRIESDGILPHLLCNRFVIYASDELVDTLARLCIYTVSTPVFADSHQWQQTADGPL